MSTLSNFLKRTTSPGAVPAESVVCRPAQPEEAHGALQLVLGTNGRRADAEQVADFLRFAAQRGINLSDLCVVEVGGQITWAVLPILSPGRTMLLFAPGDRPLKAPAAAARLIDDVCQRLGDRGVRLAQVLLETGDEEGRLLFEARSFRQMAELLYLQLLVRRGLPSPTLARSFAWATYSAQTHPAFADTISNTYQQSLDCPALNGLRDIEDIIAGHKASGEFDPRFWFLLLENDVPLAALLLSRTPRTDSAELVYLGLIPEARGRGLGALLVQQALWAAGAMGHARLTLAVDAANAPALRLYYRHGLHRVASKAALMRTLF